ncbi:hypothetical protein LQZ19_14635 [Treponema primitia]|uniref:hypothetical protein n=1 Tax=Treponema primitia TaxID=88058 RepID=UPI00397F1FBE
MSNLIMQIKKDADLLASFFILIKNKYHSLNLTFYNMISNRRRKYVTFYMGLLSIYISLITYFMNSLIFTDNIRTIKSLVTTLFLIFIIFNLLKLFCIKLKDFYIPINSERKEIRKLSVLYISLISFFVFFILFLINFPGILTTDNINQWNQIQKFEFVNWHPVIHTFLMWLLSRVINHYGFIIFCQILLFSVSIGVLLATFESWGYSRKLILFILFFLALNPMVKNILMFAYKNTVFTIFLTFTITSLINIYFSNGKWLNSILNILKLSFCIAMMTVILHNGILYTGPLTLLIIVIYAWKQKNILLTIPIIVVLVFLIRIPLYKSLDVTYPNNENSEVVGLLMTIMCDVMVKNPDVMPVESKRFLLEAETKSQWMKEYELGNYSSIKGKFDETRIINNIPTEQFLKMSIDTIMADKRNSFLAFRNHTAFVWELFPPENTFISAPWKDALFNETNKIKKIAGFISVGYDNIITSILPIGWFFANNGWQLLLLLFVGLIVFYRGNHKAAFLFIPLLFFTFSTMMLLSASDLRYFQYNSVVILPLTVALLSRNKNVSN